jgi:hypothetical protein
MIDSPYQFLVATLLASVIPFQDIRAQDQKGNLNSPAPTGPCWEIYMPNQTQPYAPILLDKCAGVTYILTKDPIADRSGKRTDSWTWRWSPLHADQDEAVLSMPNNGGTLLTPGR